MFILNGENFSNRLNYIHIRKNINLPYSQIKYIMKNFKEDENLIDLAEHILNYKTLENICCLNDMLNLIGFYLDNKKTNKFLVNFISVNAMELLRIGLTRKTFEEKFILVFGFICENSNVDLQPIKSVFEFFEEVKSILFHGRFLDCSTDNADPDAQTLFSSNISNEAFLAVKKFYLNMSNKVYLDAAFVNYLNNYLHLSVCLNSINI